MKKLLPMFIALSSLAVACGSDATPTATVGSTPTQTAEVQAPADPGDDVMLEITGFSLADVTVAPGTTVSWVNQHSVPHTVTSGEPDSSDGTWDSGTLAQADEFSFTFDQPGTYSYFCTIHPSMQGTVTVGDAAGSPGAKEEPKDDSDDLGY